MAHTPIVSSSTVLESTPLATGDAQAIITAVRADHHVEKVSLPWPADEPFAVVLPAGKTLQSVKALTDEYAEKPARRRGTAKLETVSALCGHVNRFKATETAVFVRGRLDPSPVFIAVYDYHPMGGDNTDAKFAQHRAEYALKPSPEWLAWSKVSENERGLDMGELAFFLDQHIADVYLSDADPHIMKLVDDLKLRLAGANSLLQIARNFTVNVGVKIADMRVLDSGEYAVKYDEQHSDGTGAPVNVPNAFTIAIPVYAGAAPYVVLVRLRYRATGGQVRWFLTLHRPDRVQLAALEEIVSTVRTTCDVPVFDGAPEA